MFKRYLVACKQQYRITLICLLILITSFSKCIRPTADSPRCLCYLSTELSYLSWTGRCL